MRRDLGRADRPEQSRDGRRIEARHRPYIQCFLYPPVLELATGAVCNRVLVSELPGSIPSWGLSPKPRTDVIIVQDAKEAKAETSKGKPGPQEERLIIKGDPQDAIAKLLRKNRALKLP